MSVDDVMIRAIGPEELHGVFKKKYESLKVNIIKSWEKSCPNADDSEVEVRKAIIKDQLHPYVMGALHGGCSKLEIAREVWRVFKSWGYEESEQYVKAFVTEVEDGYSGWFSTKNDLDFQSHSVFDTSSARAMASRIADVKEWGNHREFNLGVEQLDALTGGCKPGEIMVITGGPGAMKTSLLLCGVENALERGLKVLFFSLDMSPGEIMERRVMRKIGASSTDVEWMIRNGDADFEKANSYFRSLDVDLFRLIGNDGESPMISIHDVVAETKKFEPDIVCIDFVTCLRVGSLRSDLDCVNLVMPMLKQLAQTEKVSMILLSQMGRASKKEAAAGMMGGHGKGGGVVEEMAHTEIELIKDLPDESDYQRIVATVTKNRRGPSMRSFSLDYVAKSMCFTGGSAAVKYVGSKNKGRLFE